MSQLAFLIMKNIFKKEIRKETFVTQKEYKVKKENKYMQEKIKQFL